MVTDILNFVSLGRNLIHTINELRGAVASRPAQETPSSAAGGRIESLESRFGELETRSNQQHYRMVEMEQSLDKTIRATEALAHRISAIFWMASVACGLAVIGVVLAAVALARTIH